MTKTKTTILSLFLTLHEPKQMSPQPCELSSREVFTVVKSSAYRHARPKTKTKKQKQRQQKTIDMSLSQNYTELHKISLNYTTFIPILRQKSHETAVAIVNLLLFFDCLFDCSDCFYLFCFFNHVNHFPSLMFVHLFVCFVQYSCFLLVHSKKCKPTFLKQLTSCS